MKLLSSLALIPLATSDEYHPRPRHTTLKGIFKDSTSKLGQFTEPTCQVNEVCEHVPAAPFELDAPQAIHWDPAEETQEFWYDEAKQAIKNSEKSYEKIENLKKKAKYSIIFLGDGMGIPTITAGRIFKGQNFEKMINAESYKTAMDKIADDGFVGLSKTYCIDRQTTDSAASATAYLTGVKAMYQTIGLNGKGRLEDCSTQIPENYVESALKKAKKAGLATGVITTTRVHHASPSGTYANVAYRNWYSDADQNEEDRKNPNCPDLAQQAFDHMENGNIDVMMGGGYKYFIPNNQTTPFGTTGKRLDNQDLTKKWQETFPEGEFVSTREELLQKSKRNGQKMFGLFSDSDMDYKLDTAEDPNNTQPSLAEMTQAAIDNLLATEDGAENGFYLFVEGGRIDHAHHGGNAARSLGEFVDFDEAIEVARTHPALSEDETLIVITADHSHVFAMGGYGWRGYNILGPQSPDIWDYSSGDKMPNELIGYINGAGYRGDEKAIPEGKFREDLRINGADKMLDKNHLQQTAAPMSSETHGGEDVAIISRGPWSHLFKGIHQQTYVAHVMMKAQCLGDYAEDEHCKGGENSGAGMIGMSLIMTLLIIFGVN